MDKKLFDEDDSDNEVTFKSNSVYAKKYNTLRRKEELLKLKNKFGSDAVPSDDSSSSESDDDDVVLNEGLERDFFKTLSYLKKKDPKIYDNNVRFFGENAIGEPSTSKGKKNKDKPMTIRDYNREAILETGGKFSDSEDDETLKDDRAASPTYAQEQRQLKETFSAVLKEDEDESEEDIGGMFVKKKKTKEEMEEEERGYHEWLAGEANNLKNDSEENELRALKDYWSNPQLDDGEAFLRDYFLNQRFKDNTDRDRIPSYDEIVNDEECISEDEKTVGAQTEFEHKFNFRFEEPDQDFIKRYPRTLEHSMRHKDDKRARKRAELRERKAEEKKKKKEEIAQLKSLKLKEIQEKIGKLKEITGNDQLAFKDEDIEGDFDPDEHDRRMRELFDDGYYKEEADAKKPEFPDLDEELELDNWDEWNELNTEENQQNMNRNDAEPHCEDENFNMDCDYDPTKAKKKDQLDEVNDVPEGRRKKRKRKNKLAEALAKKKPIFDPEKMDKTFAEYLEEYYKLDCEDVIGDMPCRFKYREVPACDYGLTTAEILMADDQELNRWYPLKKTLQYGPDHRQRNDNQVCASKARNLELKKKILPSLFKEPEDNEDDQNNETAKEKKKRNKRKRKNKNKNSNTKNDDTTVDDAEPSTSHAEPSTSHVEPSTSHVEPSTSQIKNKKKRKHSEINGDVMGTVEENKKKRKHSEINGDVIETAEENNESIVVDDCLEDKISKKKKKKLKLQSVESEENAEVVVETKNNKKNKNNVEDICKTKKAPHTDVCETVNEESPPKKKKKKNKNKHTINGGGNISKKNDTSNNKMNDPIHNITDERLKAYGLNPKKYRGFMKYKKY